VDFLMTVMSVLILNASAYAGELDALRKIETYDSCKPYESKNQNTSFKDQIKDWVEFYSAQEVPLSLEEIYPYYQVKNGLTELSLRDLNYCGEDQSSLDRSLKNVPEEKTIAGLNQFFENSVNYEKLFSCLALEESLGDPDTSSSKKIYRTVTGKDEKPAGVKFYIDRDQPKESALNIGLFQFTPNINGNIQSCVKSWNKIFHQQKNCQIKNNDDVLSALSTSAQNFNTFCGVHKIIETASIQMRSEKSSAHFRPGQECISLQMRAGLAYNHFGPLQNSTGRNLASLTKCLNEN
jgi:hypothetical protein